MDPDIASCLTQRLLHAHFWLPTLQSMVPYSVVHDDHDGTYEPELSVVFTPDGDAHLSLKGSKASAMPSVRFRTGIGGGHALRVRTALVVLAEAIRLDSAGTPWPSSEGQPEASDGLPDVAGPATLTPEDFIRQAKVLIQDQQAALMPDNTLVAFLCDAVRMARVQVSADNDTP